MNVTSIRAENYRSYDRIDFDLPAGCVAIGGPNGSGKSSLIETIPIALYGPPPGFRSLADFLKDDAEGDLLIEIVVEHNGETYRIRRGFSPRGRGRTTLDFEIASRDLDTDGTLAWGPLTQGTAKETQATIETTFGLSRQTFCASAYLSQGDSGAFTEADPAVRKAILSEVLALDVYQRLQDLARADRTTAERELAALEGETRLLRETAETKPQAEVAAAHAGGDEHAANVDLAQREKDLEEVAEQARTAETTVAARVAAAANVAAARAEHARLQQIKTDADKAVQDKATAADEIGALATVDQVVELEQELQQLRDLQAAETIALSEHDAQVRERDLKIAQRDAITAQAEDLRQKAAALCDTADRLEASGPGESTCDHCGQTLGVEALAASLLKIRGEADELVAAAIERSEQAHDVTIGDVGNPPVRDAALAASLAATDSHLAFARLQQEQRARLQERVRGLDEKIAAAAADGFAEKLLLASEAAASAEADLASLPPAGDLDELQGHVLTAKALVDASRTKLQAARDRKTLADAHLRRVVEAVEKLAETAARRETLHGEVDVAADLERAFGRDGIPALIVESQAIPQIEIDANRILSELGTAYRVELRTQRALKSGDGLRDTLDVVVIADGGERPYETFSGGERTRINLALRIALARLLANRRGAESRLLAIDEPDGLDADGFARLADVLRAAGDTFDRVFVISHHPDLAGAFDSTLAVVKEDGRSRVAA